MTKDTRHKKDPFWAVFLQCIPLLAAGGCVVNGAGNQQAWFVAFLLWWSVLFWGLGYLYLGGFRNPRTVFALAFGPICSFVAWRLCFSDVTYGYIVFLHSTPGDPSDANRACIQTGLIIAAAVLLLAVDAWRLAARREA
jgi:hypothetical protein